MANLTGRLEEGRVRLLQQAPYFRSILHAIVYVPDARIQTLGVSSKMVLAYNPAFLQSHSVDQVAALLWHEVGHILHTFDIEKDFPLVPKSMMNQAADLHINSIGERDGWDLPESGLFPRQFGFPTCLSTLEYLDRLKKPPPEETESEGLSDGSGSGEGGEGGDGRPEPGCGSGRCHLEGDLEAELDAKYGKSELSTLASLQTLEEDMRSWAATNPGRLPAYLEEWIGLRAAPPKERPWTELLRNSLRSTILMRRGYNQTSYARPHRRAFLGDGDIVLPSTLSRKPEVTVVLDTSGSMTGDILSACLTEVRGVLQSLEIERVLLIHADTQISFKEWVNVSSLSRPFTAHGRGGTDFDLPISQVNKSREGCGSMIYLTDGYGSFPDHPPKFPVVWAVFHRAGGRKVQPPWGKTLFIPF
jgi:predicted metal-dependent peptidase